jgi:hypothetical protein
MDLSDSVLLDLILTQKEEWRTILGFRAKTSSGALKKSSLERKASEYGVRSKKLHALQEMERQTQQCTVARCDQCSISN